jgi:hypothetical protein
VQDYGIDILYSKVLERRCERLFDLFRNWLGLVVRKRLFEVLSIDASESKYVSRVSRQITRPESLSLDEEVFSLDNLRCE